MRVFRGQVIETDHEWAHRRTRDLPVRWQSRLLGRWEVHRKEYRGDALAAIDHAAVANSVLREVLDRLAVVRLPLDAQDSHICTEADKMAKRCKEISTETMPEVKPGPWAWGYVFKTMDSAPLLGTPAMRRVAMGRLALAYGIEPPGCDTLDTPAMARMGDPQWWRRNLRAVHAKQVEGAAIGLGYVHKKGDVYISNESVRRRAEQNDRNAASLESVVATNEEGDDFTLAELAAKGPANKAIRRAELMTRIAGFERIADDMGHVGVFLTITCPSRMHKWAQRSGGVFENQKYDGTLPNEAQAYLARTWAKIRSKLQRQKLGVYGFRIAEPNHDGTPHWHCLVFLDPARVDQFRAIVMHYALQDSGTERGALEHRVDWKPIDKGRGSAAGYIAKYVAKNIDGYRLDKDLFDNDAVEASHRVEAWASTWRIRQFQQLGGPPVGPWRELRRVKTIPANAPAHLVQAHQAVNKTKALDDLSDSQQQAVKGAQWDQYVRAQGGVFCGRRYEIRVEKTERDGLNKYGEPLAPVPMGISTLETYTPAHMAWMGGKATRRLIVASVRYVWAITKRVGVSIGRVCNGLKAQLSTPWTRVNNCTENFENEPTGSDTQGRFIGLGGLAESPGAHSGHGGGLCEPPHGGHASHE
jgi:hypothetical protein